VSIILPINVAVQILQVTVHNVQRVVQWSTVCWYVL